MEFGGLNQIEEEDRNKESAHSNKQASEVELSSASESCDAAGDDDDIDPNDKAPVEYRTLAQRTEGGSIRR